MEGDNQVDNGGEDDGEGSSTVIVALHSRRWYLRKRRWEDEPYHAYSARAYDELRAVGDIQGGLWSLGQKIHNTIFRQCSRLDWTSL